MQLAGLGIEFIIETAFLTLALWILVKLQKFQYTFTGLVGAAAMATVFDMIPLVGHFLAVPVLFLCMMKATREDRFSLIFTVGVSYALTFGMNLFLLSSLMGDLRVLARSRQAAVPTAVVRNDADFTDDETQTTNAVATPAPQSTDPAPVIEKVPPPEGLELKGIINGPRTASVMLLARAKTYTLFVGDSTHIDTAKGTLAITLVKVNATTAVLNVDGQEVELSK